MAALLHTNLFFQIQLVFQLFVSNLVMETEKVPKFFVNSNNVIIAFTRLPDCSVRAAKSSVH